MFTFQPGDPISISTHHGGQIVVCKKHPGFTHLREKMGARALERKRNDALSDGVSANGYASWQFLLSCWLDSRAHMVGLHVMMLSHRNYPYLTCHQKLERSMDFKQSDKALDLSWHSTSFPKQKKMEPDEKHNLLSYYVMPVSLYVTTIPF